MSRSVEAELARVAARVATSLPRFLGALTPGRFADLVADYPTRPGKALRPALCLATCRALGGREDDALEPAVTLELLHDAFLVHDDVEDESPTRRGRPSLPAEHGTALAVHVGDALVVLALGPILAARARLGSSVTSRIVEELELMARLTVEGQARDLLADRGGDVGGVGGVDDVLRTTLTKTAFYSAVAPCRIGALVATRGRSDIRRLDRFGAWLGLAYQLRDDRLDTGERRLTVATAHLLERADPADRAFVAGYLAGSGPPPRRDQDRLRSLLERHGSLAFLDAAAAALADAAVAELDRRLPDPGDDPARAFLRALPHWSIHRET